jgi:hypothetical protein
MDYPPGTALRSMFDGTPCPSAREELPRRNNIRLRCRQFSQVNVHSTPLEQGKTDVRP